MVRWCWVNFLCRGILLIKIIEGQGPTALAVGADGGRWDIFSLVCHFSSLSPSLWETTRYSLKYCLKGPLKQRQPTNQLSLLTMTYRATIHSSTRFTPNKLCLGVYCFDVVLLSDRPRDGRVLPWCWVNFQCRSVLRFGLQ